MKTTTATVETLTAEVRVLMIGNRQVTLSVAKQLDAIPLEDLDLFGRIHINDRDEDWVIGRAPDGSLAKSVYRSYSQRHAPFITADALPGQVIVCANADSRRRNSECIWLRIDDTSFEIDPEATRSCGILEHEKLHSGQCCGFEQASYSYHQGKCEHWRTNGLAESIRELLDRYRAEHEAKQARHQAAREAPLIVLAGLR